MTEQLGRSLSAQDWASWRSRHASVTWGVAVRKSGAARDRWNREFSAARGAQCGGPVQRL